MRSIFVIQLILISLIWAKMPSIVPKPKEIQYGTGSVTISRCNLKFSDSDNLSLSKIIQVHKSLFSSLTNCQQNSLEFTIQTQADQDCEDESYNLQITKNLAKIESKCQVGIIRGLATLYQLAEFNDKSNTITLDYLPIQISDSPRFSHRGILVDTARHFMGIPVLKRIIDGMMLAKLNVLHWHLTDDDSFPMESESFPGLSESAAFSAKHIFKSAEIRDLVVYALARGVRIIPEIDNPGHIRAVGLFNKLNPLVTCFNTQISNNAPANLQVVGGPPHGALDPSMDETYDFINGILKDLTGYFRDPFVHLGGDEVNQQCWDERPEIKEFMKKNGLLDYNQLLVYYLKRERELLKNIDPSKKAIYWVTENEFELNYPLGDVIQYWGHSHNIDDMKDIFPFNKFIFSPWDYFYLDCGYENPYGDNAWCGDFKTWTQMYHFEPTDHSIPESKILGGEVCAWAEVMNEDNLEQKIWPRAAAMGAVYWEPKRTGEADLPALVDALENLNQKLRRLGIRTSPITGHYCEKNSKECFQKWE